MIVPYPNIETYGSPTQAHLDWLLGAGVPLMALIRPEPVRLAIGIKAHDGIFDEDPDGAPWLCFPEIEDCVFWQPRTGELARWNGRAFALGEAAIYNAGTYSFNANLNIFESPLHWLRAKRDGCVIIDWSRCWSRLQDAPRIAVDERLLAKLKHHLQPPRLPELFVLRQRGEAAA